MDKLTNLEHLRAASQAAKGLIGEVAGTTAEALGELAEALEDLAAQQGGIPAAGGGIPSGLVAMWSGAADAAPEGWALCDGSNGTPDLRGRFVLGESSSYKRGSKGGEETVTLTVAQIPAHTHTTSAYGTGRVEVGDDPQGVYVGNKNVSTSSAGSGKAHNNMPPYYVLCYIMKL